MIERCPLLARGVPVIGLEPSCMLGFRDEFRPCCPAARRVGEKLAVRGVPAQRTQCRTARASTQAARERALLPATATRKRSPCCPRSRRSSGSYPSSKVGTIESAAAAWPELRLRSEHYDRSMKMGELACCPRAQRRRRHASRGRWHELPASDPGWCAARRDPRRASAGDERRDGSATAFEARAASAVRANRSQSIPVKPPSRPPPSSAPWYRGRVRRDQQDILRQHRQIGQLPTRCSRAPAPHPGCAHC